MVSQIVKLFALFRSDFQVWNSTLLLVLFNLQLITPVDADSKKSPTAAHHIVVFYHEPLSVCHRNKRHSFAFEQQPISCPLQLLCYYNCYQRQLPLTAHAVSVAWGRYSSGYIVYLTTCSGSNQLRMVGDLWHSFIDISNAFSNLSIALLYK